MLQRHFFLESQFLLSLSLIFIQLFQFVMKDQILVICDVTIILLKSALSLKIVLNGEEFLIPIWTIIILNYIFFSAVQLDLWGHGTHPKLCCLLVDISINFLIILLSISLIFQFLLCVIVKASLPFFTIHFLQLVFTIFLLLLHSQIVVLLLDELFTPILIPSHLLIKGDLGPEVLLLMKVNVFRFLVLLYLAFHLLVILIIIVDVLLELFIVIYSIIPQTFVLDFSLLK